MSGSRSLLGAVIVYMTIAAGVTTATAVLCAMMGWTVESRPWIALAAIAMWAPAAGAFAARRTIDRGFTAILRVDVWRAVGADALTRPLAFSLLVFGAAYAIACMAGFAHWSPGGGNWTTTRQIVANVAVNLTILAVVGTATALGEEIGWRGYLQPRLDAAGIPASVIVVSLCQVAYHAPFIALAGYASVGGVAASVAMFALGDVPWSFIAAHEAYRARSVWPAVFFHSFHNTVSQWVFPKFFSVDGHAFWLNVEAGVLPAAGYAVLAAWLYVSMRRRGQTWQTFAREAVTMPAADQRVACK